MLPGSEAKGQVAGLSLRPVIDSALFARLTAFGRRAVQRFNQLPHARRS